MFRQGDMVVHPREGVCCVEDIRTEEFQKGQPRDYYLLRPLAVGSMTVYLPVDGQRVCLREVMSADEARSLKAEAEARERVWVDNDRERQERFVDILHRAEPVELMRMAMDIRAEQTERRQTGRKLRYVDEQALQEALRALRGEVAFALGVSPEEVAI